MRGEESFADAQKPPQPATAAALDPKGEDYGLNGFRTGNPPERDGFGNGVAAQAVLAVHAARYFTGGKETFDWLPLRVDDTGFAVNR